jgi:hypothetical protein
MLLLAAVVAGTSDQLLRANTGHAQIRPIGGANWSGQNGIACQQKNGNPPMLPRPDQSVTGLRPGEKLQSEMAPIVRPHDAQKLVTVSRSDDTEGAVD